MQELAFLLLTIAIELPVALLCLRGEPIWRLVLVVVSMNLISHPIAWQLLFRYNFNWFAVEVSVAVFEGLVLAALIPKMRERAFFTGFAMNVITAAIGYLFF